MTGPKAGESENKECGAKNISEPRLSKGTPRLGFSKYGATSGNRTRDLLIRVRRLVALLPIIGGLVAVLGPGVILW